MFLKFEVKFRLIKRNISFYPWGINRKIQYFVLNH